MIEKVLPSGAKLGIAIAPFAEAKTLYQAICEEVKGLKVDASVGIDLNLRKDLFCTFLSSRKIESGIWECMKKCTYNSLKIDKDTFEPESAREDYVDVCWEVAQVNVTPFMKNLCAALGIQLVPQPKNPA